MAVMPIFNPNTILVIVTGLIVDALQQRFFDLPEETERKKDLSGSARFIYAYRDDDFRG